MLIPSITVNEVRARPSLSRRVNANSQLTGAKESQLDKLIKKGEC